MGNVVIMLEARNQRSHELCSFYISLFAYVQRIVWRTISCCISIYFYHNIHRFTPALVSYTSTGSKKLWPIIIVVVAVVIADCRPNEFPLRPTFLVPVYTIIIAWPITTEYDTSGGGRWSHELFALLEVTHAKRQASQPTGQGLSNSNRSTSNRQSSAKDDLK